MRGWIKDILDATWKFFAVGVGVVMTGVAVVSEIRGADIAGAWWFLAAALCFLAVMTVAYYQAARERNRLRESAGREAASARENQELRQEITQVRQAFDQAQRDRLIARDNDDGTVTFGTAAELDAEAGGQPSP